MVLPGNVGSGTVTGRLIDSAGAPVEGKVTFTPSPDKLLNTSALPSPVTILPKPVEVTLTDGSFTTSLVATDDLDNNPAGWTYAVRFALNGGLKMDPFSISVPEGATVDLTTVAPVGTSNGVTITRGAGVAPGGTAGQVLAKASATDYDTTWVDQSSGGGTGGAVDSVNGQTGAVVLDAAAVGALPDTYAPTWAQVTSKPATFPPSTHNHDERYYTETEVDTQLAGKADAAGGLTRIEQITASAYAALGTKGAATLYVVVG